MNTQQDKAGEEEMRLAIAHLYPGELNLYGDRGNVISLVARCRWRGIEVEVRELGLRATFEPGDADLFLIGGGPDSQQKRVAEDLVYTKGEALRRAVEEGAVLLAVCGGYQLLARYYRPAEGPDLVGLGLFDAWTVHPGPRARRCIGNVVASWEGGSLVGFENHGGRTYLGPGAVPLGKVLRGFGNNGEDGWEGARYRSAFGTYLHGALLPKNPHFADHLITLALKKRCGEVSLAPLDDALEQAAHQAAERLARRR